MTMIKSFNNFAQHFWLWLLFLLFVVSQNGYVVNGQSLVQVQERVWEQIDSLMGPPMVILSVWNNYLEGEGFPTNMNAPDRDAATKYMFSLVREIDNFKPYYSLENGLTLGFVQGGKPADSKVPVLMYREPGEGGYNPVSDQEMSIYFNVCVNEETGNEEQECQLGEGDPYISCVNGCELIQCDVDCTSLEEGSEARDDCESEVIWCQNYEVIETSATVPQLGYVPAGFYCFDSKGLNSQEPGQIVVETSPGVEILDGDCTYGDGTTLVNRQIFGPYADCGVPVEGVNGTTTPAVCNTTYEGAFTSFNFDPRYRPWYAISKSTQRPAWSDVYVFAVGGQFIGITATHPIQSTTDGEEGRTLFEGVLAADILLEQISTFLLEAFNGTKFSVAVYEAAEPYYLIGVSTGSEIISYVYKDDPTQLCDPDDEPNAEELCAYERVSVDNLQGTTEDTILRKAHQELQDFYSWDSNDGDYYEEHVCVEEERDEIDIVCVKESDDIQDTTYVATVLTYLQEGANLEWEIIVTMPLERTTEDSIVKGEEPNYYILIWVLSIFGFIICAGLFLVFFCHRNERAVVLQDFRLTSAFLVLSALLNLTCLTFLGERTDQLCMASMWLFNMLIACALSPLLLKAYRTWKLLGNTDLNRSLSRNTKVNYLWVLLIPSIEGLFLLIFSLVDPPRVTESIQDEGGTPVQSLNCEHESSAFKIIQSIIFIILVVTGSVLAWMTRNLDSRFTDSKALVFAMYNIFFVAIMFVAIFNIVDISAESRYIILTLGVFWVTVASSAVFTAPKVLRAQAERKNEKQEKVRLRHAVASEGVKKMSSVAVSNDDVHQSDNTLKVLVCSANIGNAEPTLASMKAWIPEGGYCDQVGSLDGEAISDTGRFDIIAVGMQESTWEKKGDDGGESDVGESGLEGSQKYLAALEGHDTVALREMEKRILGEGYTLVKEETRGQMRLHIFAVRNVALFLDDVEVSGANTGIGNVLANKGGIIISFEYQETRFSFMSAHLAAHEGESYYQSRCENVRDILSSSKTFNLSNKFDLSLSSHHMFVFGDLNFRTKFSEKLEEKAEHEENVRRALELIEKGDFDALYSYDELHKGIKAGDVLVGFDTLRCRFNPTFKVEREPGFVYKQQRTPSYTDRILVKSSPGLSKFVHPLCYEPCVDFVTSDHKPVRGAFSIVTNEMVEPLDIGCGFRLKFSQMECSGLPAADLNGLSDPFLRFVWDSITLKEEVEGNLLAKFRSGRNFPKTSRKDKTLNPKWGEEEMVLVSTDHEINSEAVLFIGAFDYDVGSKNDILGSIVLGIQDLVKMKRGQTFKELDMDEPLQANGRYAGRIKFKLEVTNLEDFNRRRSFMKSSKSLRFGSSTNFLTGT